MIDQSSLCLFHQLSLLTNVYRSVDILKTACGERQTAVLHSHLSKQAAFYQKDFVTNLSVNTFYRIQDKNTRRTNILEL